MDRLDLFVLDGISPVAAALRNGMSDAVPSRDCASTLLQGPECLLRRPDLNHDLRT